MRILIAAGVTANREAGTASAVYNVADGLRALGHHVDCVFADDLLPRPVLARPTFYRQLVLERARPTIEHWMSPKNWWSRFFELTSLLDASDRTEGAQLMSSAT
ncbi:MAG TPA: hypothetical protein VF860_12535 [Candidatus Acidoferrales bacterium]